MAAEPADHESRRAGWPAYHGRLRGAAEPGQHLLHEQHPAGAGLCGSLPACLPTCLPVHLPARPPAMYAICVCPACKTILCADGWGMESATPHAGHSSSGASACVFYQRHGTARYCAGRRAAHRVPANSSHPYSRAAAALTAAIPTRMHVQLLNAVPELVAWAHLEDQSGGTSRPSKAALAPAYTRLVTTMWSCQVGVRHASS